jgi:DedD protein
METRLKERLTGAAILVALIVALVPEMFRGQRGESVSTASSGGEGAPVRSYTIDLSNNPKSSVPVQTTSEETHLSTPPLPSPPNTAASVEMVKPESPKPEAIKPAMNSPARAARAATPAPPPSAPKAAPAESWSVQLGIFAKRENAERMTHEAQAKGFNVGISSADAKGLFHVRAVGLQDRVAAQTLSQRMQSEGIKSAVIPPQ